MAKQRASKRSPATGRSSTGRRVRELPTPEPRVRIWVWILGALAVALPIEGLYLLGVFGGGGPPGKDGPAVAKGPREPGREDFRRIAAARQEVSDALAASQPALARAIMVRLRAGLPAGAGWWRDDVERLENQIAAWRPETLTRPDPPPKPTPVIAMLTRIERDSDALYKGSVRRIEFERSPSGEPLKPGQRVGRMFVPWGVILEAEDEGSYVAIDPYQVRGRSWGQSCCNHRPRWRGTMRIRFCVPGQPDQPAGVRRVGLWIAAVFPGGTTLRALGLDGTVLKEIQTRTEGHDFLGLESNVPIARVEVVPGEDPDYTIDDLFFDEPKPIPAK